MPENNCAQLQCLEQLQDSQREVRYNINFNGNNSTERKHALLQQNSKLHNKFKEINAKNAILLDSNSNAVIAYNRNSQNARTNSKIPIETNGSLSFAQQKDFV